MSGQGRWWVAGLLVTSGMAGAVLHGQTSPESAGRYVLLAAKHTGTMQKELDHAAALGYRVRQVTPTSGQEIVVLMERDDASSPRSYRLLATTRTGTMENELNEAARAGYRFVRESALAKAVAASAFLPTGREEEIVVLMERDPAARERFEYRLLATTLTGTLAAEIRASEGAGFQLVDLVSRNEHIAIMERVVTEQREVRSGS